MNANGSDMKVLVWKVAVGDAIVVGEGSEAVVVQVKKYNENVVRLCVIAPGDKGIVHARNGMVMDSGE
jgi:sRNA-binding carbon storage regulator CsrA